MIESRIQRCSHRFIRYKGFTILELLITMTFVLTIIFYAIPTVNQLIVKYNLEYRKSELLTAMKEAKLAAIKSGDRVIICRTLNSAPLCAGQSSTGETNWSHGWLVFLDSNDDKNYQTDETLVLKKILAKANCSILWNRGDYLSYFKFGTLQGNAKAGSFVIKCDNQRYKVTLNWFGRVRVES